MNPPANNDESCGIGLYVINLEYSSVPMPLTVPFRYQLVGFTVFRSRSSEYGRQFFRLHLGYFESEPSAKEALAVVRKHYPNAWIAAAPTTNLGSLDNTLNTEFGLLRTTYARVVTRATDAAPSIQPPQHYAVQLKWSLVPIVAADVPRLAILKAHQLYTVHMLREGFPQQGLRLGFFTSADAARMIAKSVRHEFPEVAVVPVSRREYSRAIGLARQRQRALKAVAGGDAPITSTIARESEGRASPSRAAGLPSQP